jgi:hypothetical protein
MANIVVKGLHFSTAKSEAREALLPPMGKPAKEGVVWKTGAQLVPLPIPEFQYPLRNSVLMNPSTRFVPHCLFKHDCSVVMLGRQTRVKALKLQAN